MLYMAGSFFAFGQGHDIGSGKKQVVGTWGWIISFCAILAVMSLTGWR